MDALLSEPKLIHAKFGDEYELKVTGSSSKLFQTWVQEASDADLCSYLRAVSDGIAQRNLEHYHFKICNGKYNSRTRSQELKWSIAILYGGTAAEGPLTVSLMNPLAHICWLLQHPLYMMAAEVANA